MELVWREVDVRCWLVVSDIGFACGYGGNEKVRVSVRELRERLDVKVRERGHKNENFSKMVFPKTVIEHFIQRLSFENCHENLQ